MLPTEKGELFTLDGNMPTTQENEGFYYEKTAS